MNFKKLFKNKKAVSSAIATVFLIGIALTAVGILYGSMDLSFDSRVDEAGIITAEDYDNDGLIDTITMPLLNDGKNDADFESIIVVQNGIDYAWFTFADELGISSVDEITIYSLGIAQQIQPFLTFYVEINFEDSVYTFHGYIAAVADEVPDEILPGIDGDLGVEGFTGYDFLVSRTADDDEYANRNFQADVSFSPTFWFLLGEFEDNNKRPDLSVDYINLCGQGNELDFLPYLLDQREFTEGNIGSQCGQVVVPYEDAGDHPGLIAIDKYGNWDKKDDLNWGKRGIVYMWSYIYNPGSEAVTVNVGANGASEMKVWINGQFLLDGCPKKNKWYTTDGVTLNAGFNLIMVKISAKTNAHFAGQVLFFNEVITAQIGTLYSVWPTINDL
ncbi:MAG: hypothetical protein E3J70_10800 [Candidatus Heimdallarchaeota archaeon]|nr:MAG: hypothetical protein E3J70_10800 [Candidatus Heimdallarchaeota archaeon]